MGVLIDRVHRELTDEEIARIAGTYHAWRGDKGAVKYADLPGFCKSANLDEIVARNFALTPGRYVGAEDIEDADEPFEERFAALKAKLEEQFATSEALNRTIRASLQRMALNG